MCCGDYVFQIVYFFNGQVQVVVGCQLQQFVDQMLFVVWCYCLVDFVVLEVFDCGLFEDYVV